jgi:hypothetical protein
MYSQNTTDDERYIIGIFTGLMYLCVWLKRRESNCLQKSVWNTVFLKPLGMFPFHPKIILVNFKTEIDV